VTTPEERVKHLRDLALRATGDSEVVSDPAELSRRSIRSHLASIGALVPPDRPELDVRLHGPGIRGHEVAARQAASVLLSVQEVVASIGQAVRHQPTLQGAIQAQVLQATELRVSADLGAGSVVFHLLGPGETVTGREAPELTGTDTLLDAAMAGLVRLVEQSAATGPDSSDLARNLRPLGPRTAKHLSELIRRVIGDEIEIDFNWRNPAGTRRGASLQRPAAEALERAISQNKEESHVIELAGDLRAIDAEGKADLRTPDGRVRMSVSRELAATLGPLFNEHVVATIERVTTWSTSTGKERKIFRLLAVRRDPSQPGDR
jgi:hypothetical protein